MSYIISKYLFYYCGKNNKFFPGQVNCFVSHLFQLFNGHDFPQKYSYSFYRNKKSLTSNLNLMLAFPTSSSSSSTFPHYKQCYLIKVDGEKIKSFIIIYNLESDKLEEKSVNSKYSNKKI